MSTGVDTVGSSEDVTVGNGPLLTTRADGRAPTWRRALVRVTVTVDLAAFVLVATLAVAVGVHDTARSWELGRALTLGAVCGGVVVLSMAASRCWDQRILGQGAEELRRVVRALVLAVLLLASGATLFTVGDMRPWAFGVVPATGLAVVAGRYLVRRGLHASRRLEAACMSSVLVVGSDATVADFVARARRVPQHGWVVTAACTPDGLSSREIAGTAVVGDLDDVGRCVLDRGIDIVAVTPTPGWTAKRLHRLAWQLEGRGVELVVDPGLMEIGGPRLHMAPVDGLPLLRLTEPRFSGFTRIVKNAVERVLAAFLVLVLAPVLLLIAVLVKRDGGPVFFRQARVGQSGRNFRMVKFRSMVVDADRVVTTLAECNEGAGPLFKMKSDPRVTRVGRMLRRLSLDELPQLFNVVGGSMSLVGPRPPLPREVETYADDARRRLLVRPGMTGLWQVSGRSDLSWEESLRLDLRYVENWSPVLDISILWKTVGAVLKGRGAY